MAVLYFFLENLSLFLCQGLNYKEIQWIPFSMFHLSSQSSHQPLSFESKKIVCNLQSQVMILQGGLSGSVKIQSGTKTTITLHLCKGLHLLKEFSLCIKRVFRVFSRHVRLVNSGSTTQKIFLLIIQMQSLYLAYFINTLHHFPEQKYPKN